MNESREIGQMQNESIDFRKILDGVKNYEGIQAAIEKSINDMKQRGIERIGFVSGPGGKDDPDPKLERESRDKDMRRMREHTTELREKHEYPIFASTDIFDEVWEDLEETKLTRGERKLLMTELFRGILKGGVTDIFMMEGWKGAPGAVDEHDFSERIGITIHDPKQTPLNRVIIRHDILLPENP